MNIFEYIKENYPSFTEGEKSIADYLVNIDDKIIGMSSKELGETTGTSAPTVVRFSKKLGFDSFNELKLKLSLDLVNKGEEKAKGFEYIGKNLTTKDIMNGIRNSINNTINKTFDVLSEEELKKAIEVLSKAKKIYIFGVGASALVGMDFQYKLMRINKVVLMNIDTHMQLSSATLMEEGDVAIGISYSGKTKEVLKCIEVAKNHKASTIVITKSGLENKLADMADIKLLIPSIEKNLREGAMSSRISQLSIIDMLYIGIAKDNIDVVENNLIKTRSVIEEFEK